MSNDDLPASMQRDLTALEYAADTFERRHGEEAQQRWEKLGAPPHTELTERQAAVVRLDESIEAPNVWEALAWEVSCRIDLVEHARAELRKGSLP